MNVWGYLLVGILCVTAFILLLALLYNLAMVWIAGRFSGKTIQKHLQKLEKELPGKNCGACGCESCAQYAHAVFTCRMDTDRCPEGGPDLAQKLNDHMDAFQKILDDEKETKKKVRKPKA